MERPKILLDPVDFDALHLSALEVGGIGQGFTKDFDGPVCKMGHAVVLDNGMNQRLCNAGLTAMANDETLEAAGIPAGQRIPFERYVELLNIDVKEAE